MTAKEIEVARKVIYDELRYHGVDNSSTIDALELLDALCAAAREDRLVNKRVRSGKSIGTVTGQHVEYSVDFDGIERHHLWRKDFEILEGDDAE